MQPIFFSFASGLHYRKTVKLYFRSILPFDLVVSIYENMPFRLYSSFLTAGNKSKCGTLQRLTGSQQSTDKPIFRPVSPPKRQVMQGKSLSCRRYTLELLPTCENIGLQSHLGSRSSQATPSHSHSRTPAAPRRPPATPRYAPSRTPPSAPTLPPHPSHTHSRTPRRSPSHSRTPDAPSGPPQPHPQRPLPPRPTLPPHPKVACNSQTEVTQQHKVIRTSRLVRGNCMRNCST